MINVTNKKVNMSKIYEDRKNDRKYVNVSLILHIWTFEVSDKSCTIITISGLFL